MMQLHTFLNAKPLFYDEIDYTRMPKAYASIAHHFPVPKIIHIVGTNGKGTTGRFLASMLLANKVRVGHYTSPHILDFNERIWLNGANVGNETLEQAHQHLLSWLDSSLASALSYFEYTTLLAMVVYAHTCDYVVLEAGLGGEFDATNCFPKVLSVVTPIGYDHQAFLGESIEEIAQTKINSVTNHLILAPQYESEVCAIALAKTTALHTSLYDVGSYFDDKTSSEIDAYCQRQGLPEYLKNNFKTALCALSVLGYGCDLSCFEPMVLSGRFQRLLPNVIVDVGHNVMAAEAIVKSLGKNKVVLVYNSYKDKDFKTILSILKPVIKSILVIDIDSPRAVDESLLYNVAKELGVNISPFVQIQKDEEYVVFGSFSVVEAFLKGLRER